MSSKGRRRSAATTSPSETTLSRNFFRISRRRFPSWFHPIGFPDALLDGERVSISWTSGNAGADVGQVRGDALVVAREERVGDGLGRGQRVGDELGIISSQRSRTPARLLDQRDRDSPFPRRTPGAPHRTFPRPSRGALRGLPVGVVPRGPGVEARHLVHVLCSSPRRSASFTTLISTRHAGRRRPAQAQVLHDAPADVLLAAVDLLSARRSPRGVLVSPPESTFPPSGNPLPVAHHLLELVQHLN